MPKLYVAMFRPEAGNYEHWALYLDHSPEHTIYEVIGDSPTFQPSVSSGKPTSSLRHRRSIFVYDIIAVDIPALEKAISTMEPDNSTSHWNCQDYVIEILDKLEEEFIIDGDDEEFISAKEEVKEYFGPM